MKAKTVLEGYEEKRELDILAERDNGDTIGIEIQMYAETAPF